MKKTLQQHAQDALDVQNACNLSGVVYSLATCVGDLWEEARRLKKGTDWVNQHPIVQMYVDKLSSLTGLHNVLGKAYCDMFDLVEQMAKGEYPDDLIVHWDIAQSYPHDISGLPDNDPIGYQYYKKDGIYYPDLTAKIN